MRSCSFKEGKGRPLAGLGLLGKTRYSSVAGFPHPCPAIHGLFACRSLTERLEETRGHQGRDSSSVTRRHRKWWVGLRRSGGENWGSHHLTPDSPGGGQMSIAIARAGKVDVQQGCVCITREGASGNAEGRISRRMSCVFWKLGRIGGKALA